MTVVRPPSIPFGWKVIPQTADAASVTLRVNLERLNIRFALDGFVMDVELRGKSTEGMWTITSCWRS